MLQLIGSLLDKQVMSLRTGGRIATTQSVILNPNNLKLEGLYCLDAFDKKKQLVLLYQDIRDVIEKGIVVNDHEALTEPEDLIRLKDIIKMDFHLIGKPVHTTNKKKLGKVNDYAIETSSMYVQKIYVGQSLVKSFTGGSLSVDRSQIVEITNRKIVIQEPLQPQSIEATSAAPA